MLLKNLDVLKAFALGEAGTRERPQSNKRLQTHLSIDLKKSKCRKQVIIYGSD